MRRALRVFAAAVFMLCAGCTDDDLTEVIVVVDSQSTFRSALSNVHLTVRGPSGTTLVDEAFDADGSVDAILPRTLSLSPADGVRATAWIEVIANGPTFAALRREATIPFASGERRFLRLLLHPSCVGTTCAQGQTCGNDGVCRAIEIEESELEPWSGVVPPPPTCTKAEMAAPERCDRLDNDCDARIDEDVAAQACETGQEGVCNAGTQACVAGEWAECVQSEASSLDICDGKDNDCDGVVDQNRDLWPCSTDEGECVRGWNHCMGEIGWVCMGAVHPEIERCDYKDNDCDGTIDEEVCL